MTAEQQQKLEQVRARLDEDYRPVHMDGFDTWTALDDIHTLLQIIDAQQAVIDAARVYRERIDALLSEITGDPDMAYEDDWKALCKALDNTGQGTAEDTAQADS
jgi:hypothetical protein